MVRRPGRPSQWRAAGPLPRPDRPTTGGGAGTLPGPASAKRSERRRPRCVRRSESHTAAVVRRIEVNSDGRLPETADQTPHERKIHATDEFGELVCEVPERAVLENEASPRWARLEA